ncbi:MAG TPA: DUF3426 domain-containing protein [Pseudomonadales bacterium]|nr:DUF3426 domain-containing protein [Pseudomonadales bacterium]
MHGITRCPQCHTAFNVAHKQLAKASGKVRCGICKHAFVAANFWVVAEFDDAELAFERPPISFHKAPRRIWPMLFSSAIILSGCLAATAQWLHHYPASINAYPAIEQVRQQTYLWMGWQAPPAIDWPALTIGHYVAQSLPDDANTLRIQGLLVNHSHTPQKAPDLLLTLWLANGDKHSARIPAKHIVRKADRLAPQRQSQFYFDIDRPTEDVARVTLELCCQQKN